VSGRKQYITVVTTKSCTKPQLNKDGNSTCLLEFSAALVGTLITVVMAIFVYGLPGDQISSAKLYS